MARPSKKEKDVDVDVVEETEEVKDDVASKDVVSIETPVNRNLNYDAMKAIIDAYKVSNPEKYAVKKAELERKLAAYKN